MAKMLSLLWETFSYVSTSFFSPSSAMRFALMEVKAALAHLVLVADLQLAPGQEELQFENSPLTLRPSNGVTMLLTPLTEK